VESEQLALVILSKLGFGSEELLQKHFKCHDAILVLLH